MKSFFPVNEEFLLCFLIAGSIFTFASCKDQPAKTFLPLSSSETHIEFENEPASNDKLGILYYINYYSGGGVATGDINNDGLTDIYFSANDKGKNKLYLNKGNFTFEDITVKAGVAGISDWCTGVTMADVNADGFLDIYVCAVSKKHGLSGRNQLFINNQNGTFTEAAVQYALDFSGYSTQAAFFDYDHDGDLDCFLLNQSDHPHQYIVDTSYRRRFDANSGNRLFRNDLNTPEKKFSDVTALAGIYESFLCFGLGIAVADLNNDGWEDIYVGNDFHENDYYYVNNGDGTFTESGARAFSHYSRFSMGNDVADFDNDGNLDVFTVDMLPPDEKILKTYGSDERIDIYNYKIINHGYQPQFSRNCLQRNNGDGKSFSDIGLIAGVAATDWSWTPLVADFDNDGCKDIFVSSGIVKRTADLDYVRFVADLSKRKSFDNSPDLDAKALEKMPDGSSYCFIFKGNAKGNFEDKSTEWGIANKKGYYTAAAYADFDNDGDLDIVVNPVRSKALIYKNNSADKNYIEIKFHGDSLNTFGIGTKAYVFQKGRIQFEQLMLTRGFQSASFSALHFGLDTTVSVDSLLIVWPDAKYQLIKNVPVNKLLTVEKKDAAGKFAFYNFFPQKDPSFFQIASLLTQPWKHDEDPILDFNSQYLIPHALSIRGPKVAVADINKDRLDDFYVCGAKGQSGKLFVQNANGKFDATDSSAFAGDADCEDVDACFCDVNGDAYPDLYVVSGGNSYKGNNPLLLDRLYLNDKGHFTKAQNNLPLLYANKSCVSSADIDADGDEDIFVGSLSEPDAYGLAGTSYLLINDGRGIFTIADQKTINLKNIGMVTASAITDVNKDGRNDLIVAGEWMPITVFINEKNKFSSHQLSTSKGLWQCLKISDVNDDGFPDILAGNWGLNSKLAAGKNGPLKLYVKDFDANGTIDPILAYTINNTEYTFLQKDELEQVLPVIKKKFLYCSQFAGKPVQDVFDVSADDVLKLQADDLASAVFINDGKGNFRKVHLSMDLQLSPIFAFQQAKNTQSYVAGGNFNGVLPYEGQYDAASLISFDMSKTNGGDVFVRQSNILDTKAQVRDLKWLHTPNGDVLIVARNNGSFLFYKQPERPAKD